MSDLKLQYKAYLAYRRKFCYIATVTQGFLAKCYILSTLSHFRGHALEIGMQRIFFTYGECMSIPEIALIEAGYSKEDAKKINAIMSEHCLTRHDLRTALAKHKIENATVAVKPQKPKSVFKVMILGLIGLVIIKSLLIFLLGAF